MKYVMLFSLFVSWQAYGSDIRILRQDSIPDSTAKLLPSGLKTSGLSLGTGIGAALFGTILLTQSGNASFDDKSGLYAVGMIVGLVAIITGIVSLTRNKHLVKSGKPAQRDDIRRTKGRATAGIILGVLGMAASIVMMLLNSGTMGF